jgi:hypothetical protein
VSPWRTCLAAGRTGCATDPEILLERDTDHHDITGDTNDFSANSFEKIGRDVLKNLSTNDKVKCAITKIQLTGVPFDRLDARMIDIGFFKIQRHDAIEALREQYREVPITRANIQSDLPLLRDEIEQITGACPFQIARSAYNKFFCHRFLGLFHSNGTSAVSGIKFPTDSHGLWQLPQFKHSIKRVGSV